MTAIIQQQRQRQGGGDPDLIYVQESPKIPSEISSGLPRAGIRLPQKIIHGVEQQKAQQLCLPPRQRVTAEDIKSIANDIFEAKGRGISYKDLLKGKYKRVDSLVQAQKILKYHKARGTLHTNYYITIPQQYFLSKADAKEAAIHYNKNTRKMLYGRTNNNVLHKSSRHPHPTGVRDPRPDISEQLGNLQMAIEDKKADNIYEVLDRIAEDTDGHLPVGMHNIRIHLTLEPDYASEAYYERLTHIPEPSTREKAKKVEAIIDDFKVECLFYPSGKVVIMVPCSDNPFPIALDSPDLVTSDFTSFTAQIRRIICTHLSDYRGRIVPPLHSPVWRLIHADLNWDVPTTMLNYLGMDGLQLVKVGDVIQRLYRKRIKGERFIRVEEGVHAFRNAPIIAAATAADSSVTIGETIIAAVRNAQKEMLSSSLGGGGVVSSA